MGASFGPGSIRYAHEAGSRLRPSGDDPLRGVETEGRCETKKENGLIWLTHARTVFATLAHADDDEAQTRAL